MCSTRDRQRPADIGGDVDDRDLDRGAMKQTLRSYNSTLRRTPMKRTRKPSTWPAERDAHLRSEPTCQARRYKLPGLHWGPLDVHHISARGMGGTRGATGPLVTLCRVHHDWVEANRDDARERGLLMRRK